MPILTRSHSYSTRIINVLATMIGGCVYCHQGSSHAVFSHRLCIKCTDQIQGLIVGQYRCQTCAAPLSTNDAMCLDCLIKPPLIQRTLAFADYSGLVQSLIVNYKFHHHLSYAPLLADMLSYTLQQHPITPDIIITVPQHEHITRVRGFVPLQYIARCIDWSRIYPQSTPPLWRQATVRLHHQHLQVGAKVVDRHRQVKGAFASTTDFTGLHVMLIDDVYTTGATLNELARVCLAAGAKEVSSLVIARSRLVK